MADWPNALTAAPAAMTKPRSAAPNLLVALAVAGVIAFLTFFFSLDLPNSGPPEARIPRLQIWLLSLGLLDQPAPICNTLDQVMQVRWLPDRVRIIAQSLLIAAAAAGIGQFILRIGTRHTARPPLFLASPPITRSEWCVLIYGTGISALSLATLGLGLAGWLSRGWFTGFLAVAAVYAASSVVMQVLRPDNPRHATGGTESPAREETRLPMFHRVASVFAISVFLTISLLGALLPATDFDVREYHLQVPKEFFLAGRIGFVAHNVYGNMPFFTEMIHLLGMVLAGDWWWGSLVGQVTLAIFAPMTGLAVYCLGRRLFGDGAGWLGALIYIGTPWVYRISIIPYTESALNFFLAAGTMAALLALGRVEWPGAAGYWCLAGLMAGSAAACKYPGLISTVLPLGLVAAVSPIVRNGIGRDWPALLRRTGRTVAGFAIGFAVTFGPWLAKNTITTGNPLYPLLYRVFGGRNWTDEKNQKWEWGHRVALLAATGIQKPPAGRSYSPGDPQISLSPRRLKENLIDVAAQADWQSPLVFAFAPLALLVPHHRKQALLLWLFLLFLFLQWWLLTHRLDRFWLPILPVASILAGAGAVWTRSATWRCMSFVAIAACLIFNMSLCMTPLCGDNRYALRLEPRVDPMAFMVNWLNQNLPADAKLLAVGAADLFHLDRAVVYNTVFDDCIFEQWARNRLELAQPPEHKDELEITHVYVNWREVQRYREPGSYGYTDFVTPAVFHDLVQNGTLRRVESFGELIELRENVRVPMIQLFAVARD